MAQETDWESYASRGRAGVRRGRSRRDRGRARRATWAARARSRSALRGVRDRETGMLLNGVRPRLEEAVDAREAALAAEELDRRLREEVIDVTLPGEELPLGHLHPITQVRRAVEDAFLGLGYEVRDDREVETVEYNFDKLAFLPTHSARSPRDTFFFDETHVLRTETSPSQIHILEEKPPPIYMVSIGRVYRRDAITATRYPIFHQFEGLAVDKGLTLADLKGTLLHVMRALYGPERRVRFRTHYFPFTEPSIEPDVSCGICDGAGCRTCKFSGWIEMGGAGMVDPRVLRERRPRSRGVGRASRSAAGSSARPSSATTSRTSAPSGRATCACCVNLMGGSSDAGPRLLAAGLRRRSRCRSTELADAALGRDRRGRGDRAPRRRRRGRQPRPVQGRPGARGGEASERRPAPAHEGGRRRGRAALDRLRRLELRRRRDRRRRAARRAAAERARARAARGARPGLRRDDPRRGRDRPRRRPRRDHAPPRDRAGHAALRRAAARRRRPRGRGDRQPARPPVHLRHRARDRDPLRPASSGRDRGQSPATSRGDGRDSDRRLRGAARATSGGCSRT